MNADTHNAQTYRRNISRYLFLLALIALLFPSGVAAARTGLEVAGWIPYWQAEEGTGSAIEHLRKLDTLHPFVYDVRSDGTLEEKSDIESEQWEELFEEAERHRVEVIPTISWFDGAAIHEVLNDRRLRERHIEEIVELVDRNDFDGIDIDYENKRAETMDDFSEFLEDLKDELGRKTLTCTVEARTPPASKWRVVPVEIEYANDYQVIGRTCDRVEIMAYDQQRVDWQLNTDKRGEPYIPVADTEWVEKVLELALEDIDEDKIMLGVPTYGREWTLTVEPNWYKAYEHVTSLNMPDVVEIAETYEITPGRNKAGEMSFSYFPEESVFSVLEQLPVPEGTRAGNEAAAKALLFANATGMAVPVNVVWYSDAGAIKEKAELAEKYSVRGVSIFKIDGEEDEALWDIF